MNLIASFIIGWGQVLTFSGTWSIIPDAADYGEYKNNVHAPGAMYAIANFGLKMGMTMASTLLGWGLMASGFDQTAAVQAAGVANGLRIFNAVSLIIAHRLRPAGADPLQADRREVQGNLRGPCSAPSERAVISPISTF